MFCRTAGCAIIDTWDAGGLRGTGSHDVVVHDLFVPERHASAFLDPPVLTEDRYRVSSQSRTIPGAGMIALGVARAAIDALVELAAAKRPERSPALTLAEDRAAQFRLAQAEALVQSARLFLLDAVTRLWDTALAAEEATLDARVRVRLATYHAVASAVQAVDLVYLTGGASSLYTSSPLERAFRDAHAITQHIAVQPRVAETAGQVLFGLAPAFPIV
jgi:alkylation response protein AidB-like acyl-CoA dehydrogenase